MSYFMFENMNSYDTPDDVKTSLVFKLMFKSRWYFYWKNFGIFIKAGSFGAKGQLTKENQIICSSGNIRLIERCGSKIHLRGLDNLRKLDGRPVVIVANHMSLLETAAIHAIMREYVDFSFVVKESLMHVPYFKDILIALGAIPLERKSARDDLKKVLVEGKKILQAGRSIIIFPQGQRTPTFVPAEFNTLGVKLAKSAGVPILPVALKTDFITNGKLCRDLGPIHPGRDVWFEFGEPIPVEGNGQDAHQKSIDFIQSCFNHW